MAHGTSRRQWPCWATLIVLTVSLFTPTQPGYPGKSWDQHGSAAPKAWQRRGAGVGGSEVAHPHPSLVATSAASAESLHHLICPMEGRKETHRAGFSLKRKG